MGNCVTYHLEIDQTARVATFVFTGEMTAQIGQQAFLDYINRPEFDPTMPMVTDATGVTGVTSGYTEILFKVTALLPHIRRFKTPVSSTILVSQDVPYGMARMLSSVMDAMSNIKIDVQFVDPHPPGQSTNADGSGVNGKVICSPPAGIPSGDKT